MRSALTIVAAAAALTAASATDARANVAPDGLVLQGSTVAENLAPGAIVGTLVALDADPGDTHTYLLVENPGDRFAVDAATGVVTTQVTLDYEDDALHSIRVRATDLGGLWIERTFSITVLDRNDPPTGVALNVSGVPEDAQLDAVVGTFQALGDNDAGDAWTFVLQDNAEGRFAIEGNRLRVASPLDHESSPLAVIEVTVLDRAGASATSTFVLDIYDRNEAPQGVGITGAPIVENAPPGSLVGTLVATGDPDHGDTWTFELRTSGVPFVVNGSALYTTAALDFEAKPTWTVTLRVTDRGGKQAESAVTVFVADAPEAPTGVTLVGAGVTENAAPGAVAGTLQAQDPDVGDSHTFAIVAGEGFTLVGASLVTTMTFDYEATPVRVLQVRVTDSTSRSITADLSVPVINVDEPPTDILLSNTSVQENTPTNALVGFLQAIDPDGGGATQFVLVDDGAGGFRIEGSTLRVAANLDYEATPTRGIVVRALIPNGAYLDRAFTITIVDVDESATAVILDKTAVRENQPIGTVVGHLQPSGDPDDDSGYVYTLLQNPGSNFAIVGDALVTNAVLDYETTRNLQIRIRATSPANVSVESQMQIDVLDEPEPPTSIVVSGAVVQEGRDPGVFVATLFAQGDPDQNDRHTFTLVSNPDNAFTINAGTLSTAKRLDYEARAIYPLTIRATDTAGLFIETTVDVYVLDVNEAPTGVDLAPRTFREDLAIPGVIGTLTAVGDPDANERHTFTLAQNPEDRFDIIGDQLLLRKAVDYETSAQTFRVDVRVRDAGNLQAEAAFYVDVLDVNEPPSPLSLPTRSVAENAPAGTVVGTIGGGVDPDLDDVATLTITSDPGGAFAIDAERRLVTTRVLNHEVEPLLSVTVRLTDSGGLFTESAWDITIADVNEPPTGVGLSWSALPEGAGLGWVVGIVSATGDPDVGATFTFSLVEDAEHTFALDGANLVLAGPLDYETATGYVVIVKATDQGGLWVEREFLIKVLDENDPPTIALEMVALPDVVEDDDDPAGATTAEIFEELGVVDVDAGADVVLRVKAIDGAHGQWQLDGAPLEVGAALVRGEHVVRFVPTAEFAGAATLEVSADDGQVESAPATLVVTVTPVNDPPVVDAPALVEAWENAPVAVPAGVVDIDASELIVTVTGVDIDVPSAFASIEGTPDEVDEALADLVVTPSAGFVGEGTLTITANDLGGSGAGGPKAVSRDVRIDVRGAPDLRVTRNGRTLSPAAPEALGTLGVGAWKTVWLDLENRGSRELAFIAQPSATGALLVVRPAARIAPGASTRMALALRPLATGSHTATLRLASTDVDPVEHVITLTGNAILVGDLRVSDAGRPLWSGLPHQLVDLRPGRAQALAFRLDNVGAARLELVSAELESAVNCDVSVVPPFPLLETAGPELLEIFVTPEGVGRVSARIVLETNDPDAERFVFELVGAARAQSAARPVLERLPGRTLEAGATDDVGSATSGVEVAVSYRLVNLGTVTLDPRKLGIGALDNADADVVAAVPDSLGVGESLDLVVFATPLAAGPFAIELALGEHRWTVSGLADASERRPLRLLRYGEAGALLAQADIGPLALLEPKTVGFVIENATATPTLLDLPIATSGATLLDDAGRPRADPSPGLDAIARQPDAAIPPFGGVVVPLEITARGPGASAFDLHWTASDVLHVTSAGQVGQLVFAREGAPIDGATLQLSLLKTGVDVDVTIALVNAGTGPLALGEVTLSGGKACAALVPPSQTTLAAAEATEVVVRLDPIAGAFACTLTVTSDDPMQPTASLVVAARGAASGKKGGCQSGDAGADLALIVLALALLARAGWSSRRRARRARVTAETAAACRP